MGRFGQETNRRSPLYLAVCIPTRSDQERGIHSAEYQFAQPDGHFRVTPTGPRDWVDIGPGRKKAAPAKIPPPMSRNLQETEARKRECPTLGEIENDFLITAITKMGILAGR